MISKGFTLIELLLSVAILGILAGTTLILLDPAEMRNRAQDAVRREDVAVIAGALERYYADNNAYPTSLPVAPNALQNPAGTITYLREMPLDPDGNSYTFTNPSGTNQTFKVCITLEEPGGATNPFCITNAF